MSRYFTRPARAVRLLLLVMLVHALVLSTAPASGAPGGIRLSSPPLPHPQPTGAQGNQDFVGKTVWVWGEGRRGFQLAGYNSHPKVRGFDWLVSYDLGTRTEVARTRLAPAAWSSGHPNEYPYGQSETVAVDQADGRLFVAYGIPGPDLLTTAALPWTGPGGSLINPGTWDPNRPVTETNLDHTLNGDVCVWHRIDAKHPCVGGFHVLDARTLQPRRARVPLRPLSLDGGPMTPILRAMSYAPPRAQGDAGKVLMVLEEHAVQPASLGLAPMARNLHNVVHVVQLDPDSGAQDWSVRLDACNGARESTHQLYYAPRAGAAAVFRSPDIADPAVWVGCHGRDGQASIVRLPLDAEGRPAALPVAAADTPLEVEAFAGPRGTTGYLADPASQRLLLKVEDEGDETWHVFDGVKRSVVGTIEIGPFQRRHTSSGIDPESGRLYVLAGGKLHVADIRRDPLPPQLVVDIGLSTLSPFPLSVAPGARGRPTEVFARLATSSGGPDPSGYAVLLDHRP